MAWPTLNAPANGFLIQGRTTIIWHTDDMVPLVAGIDTTSGNGTYGAAVVTRFNQRTLNDNIKLTGNVGHTTTRILIIDGAQWDVTIRDDTRFGTTSPAVGMRVTIIDAGGLLGSITIANGSGTPTSLTSRKSFRATIVESNWESSPKNPGERSFTIEKLVLIDENA